MTDDLVKRLLDIAGDTNEENETLHEAADRIERLEAARDGAYTERNRLVAFLSNIYPSGVKKTAIPEWDEAWHNCVYIDLPVGQASWHYHNDETHLFAHLPPYESEWDGHTTEEKYERISLAANHAKQTDELLADYMKFADALMIQTNSQNKRIEKLEAALDEAAFSQTLFDAVVGQRNKATDRIEKLEAALREMLEKCTWAKREKWCGSLDCHCQIARKALEGKDAPQEPV
jgi:hypothetical protein